MLRVYAVERTKATGVVSVHLTREHAQSQRDGSTYRTINAYMVEGTKGYSTFVSAAWGRDVIALLSQVVHRAVGELAIQAIYARDLLKRSVTETRRFESEETMMGNAREGVVEPEGDQLDYPQLLKHMSEMNTEIKNVNADLRMFKGRVEAFMVESSGAREWRRGMDAEAKDRIAEADGEEPMTEAHRKAAARGFSVDYGILDEPKEQHGLSTHAEAEGMVSEDDCPEGGPHCPVCEGGVVSQQRIKRMFDAASDGYTWMAYRCTACGNAYAIPEEG